MKRGHVGDVVLGDDGTGSGGGSTLSPTYNAWQLSGEGGRSVAFAWSQPPTAIVVIGGGGT